MEFWLVGHVWGCSTHFHELIIKQLLFLDKLATTLVKSAPPCKISKLDFWISQTVSLWGSFQVKPPLEGIFVNLIYMNNVPSITLSVVKVYETIINHFTQLLYQFLMITCDEAIKQSIHSNVAIPCFIGFITFVAILNLPHSYHVAMFQGMRNSCCIHMLHPLPSK